MAEFPRDQQNIIDKKDLIGYLAHTSNLPSYRTVFNTAVEPLFAYFHWKKVVFS